MKPTNDEGDIMFNTFQYLNNQSIYLEFKTSDFSLGEVVRNQVGEIEAATFRLDDKMIDSFLARLPYSVIDGPNQGELQVIYTDNLEGDLLVKATLLVQNTLTGQRDVVEVT